MTSQIPLMPTSAHRQANAVAGRSRPPRWPGYLRYPWGPKWRWDIHGEKWEKQPAISGWITKNPSKIRCCWSHLRAIWGWYPLRSIVPVTKTVIHPDYIHRDGISSTMTLWVCTMIDILQYVTIIYNAYVCLLLYPWYWAYHPCINRY